METVKHTNEVKEVNDFSLLNSDTCSPVSLQILPLDKKLEKNSHSKLNITCTIYYYNVIE